MDQELRITVKKLNIPFKFLSRAVPLSASTGKKKDWRRPEMPWWVRRGTEIGNRGEVGQTDTSAGASQLISAGYAKQTSSEMTCYEVTHGNV